MTSSQHVPKLQTPIVAFLFPWIHLLSQGRRRLGILFLLFEALSGYVLTHGMLRSTTDALLAPYEGLSIFVTVTLIDIIGRFLCVISATRAHTRSYMESYSRIISRRLSRDPKGVLGLLVLGGFVFLLLVAPLISSDPLVMNFGAVLQKPSPTHLLGTDMYGRDVFSRIVYGTRYTLGIGVTATALNILLGATLGLVAGYFRGAIDAILMRILEILNSIPFLMLAILIVAMFGSSTSLLIVVLSVFVLQPARIVRSQVLELRDKDYVKAAKAIGATPIRIIFCHLLPNTMGTLLVVASIRVGQNILSLAGLSFLGMGITPPTPSWGSMLQEGRSVILQCPWLGIFPGMAIFTTVLAFNLVGDSLRDALDPRLKL